MSQVLIVDDDPGLRRIAKTALSLDGNKVLLASDGLEALEILSREPVNLMIVDLVMPLMPGMDGRSTVKEARREGYTGPVLIVSEYEAGTAVNDLRADAMLGKPFEILDFLSCVHDLLDRP